MNRNKRKSPTMPKNGKKKPQVETNIPVVEIAPIPMDDKGKKSEVRMSMMEMDDRLRASGMKTKSAMIRLLWDDGYSRAAIAKYLGIRYQHVRNVLTKELKRGPQIIVPDEPTTETTDAAEESDTPTQE